MRAGGEMKLTDFLQDVGRPVAYYPALRRITGSTNATILLCQFIYWRGKESDPKGWLYKTSEEIENETGLSYDEQKNARLKLKEAGLMEEHYARLDHQMRFRLNIDAINELWGTPQSDIPEHGKTAFGNEANPLSLNESESTAENTNTPSAILSEQDFKEAGEKAQKIIELSQGPAWQGRDELQAQSLPLADWYNSTTGQVMTKRVKKSWWKALSDWRDEGLEIEHLQAAYEAQKAWRMVSDPNMLTKDAVAIKAAGKAKPKVQHKVYRPEEHEEPKYVPAPPRKR